jgi:xanthine dehydrogenase accessory factor
MTALILIRGGGDLASGVAYRLHRAGLNVVITELPQPLAVRRLVSFAQAVYEGQVTVEGITARRVDDPSDRLRIMQILSRRQIPVLIDPEAREALKLFPLAIVDARMTKQPPETLSHRAMLYIGLGPGFVAGQNCDAVIETNRGHTLGRVYWQGGPQADTRLPEGDPRRVLRAPAAGVFHAVRSLGEHCEEGDLVAWVEDAQGQRHPIYSPFRGVLRGLLYEGLGVEAGMKVGDIDPRDHPGYCSLISEKSLAIGGGVLEALLTRPEVRAKLWA